ncbi:hypothetical protein FBU30_004042 [Linnemannia zychae]|nr:hypothetical protein FBU30_004042 [Linnemannia zychae]
MISSKVIVLVASSMLLVLSQQVDIVAGQFIYKNSAGKSSKITHPAVGKCIPFDFAAGSLVNHIQAVVTAYATRDCKGNDVTLLPQQDITLPDIFNSVKYHSTK